MRFLPSPSTSSSSTSTHFDANMCTSRSATASCFSRILRQILCSRSLPTHSSDHITETRSLGRENKNQELSHSNEKIESPTATAPGIVSRLMGLENLPDTSTTDMQVSFSSMSGSRSMNSVEFRGEWDQMQGNCGGSKNTLVFREENAEFFVLSFGIECESKKVMSKGRKFEVGSKELRQKRGGKCKSGENRRERVALEKKEDQEIIKTMIFRVVDEKESSRRISEKLVSEFDYCSKVEDTCEQSNVVIEEAEKSNCTSQKEDFDRTKLRKQRKKANGRFEIENEELESSSEDSSPVSVLDFGHFIIDPEVSTSDEDTNSEESNSRRKLTPEFANHNYLSQHGGGYLIGDDQNSRRRVGQSPDHMNMWVEILRLAGGAKSNWKHKNVREFKDFEEIIADFGSQILDELLEEMVDQLS